ncbi:membrane protein [Staphylococcus aureus]|uniref:membrane protein n=1 Tax=Staphylococcus aureus TaxID=1280 RepID=UPI000445E6E4|nr:membrane protein [Staphylococcus aureus]EWW20108.1 hypothetical protein V271_02619 [Staphylococcus aureus H38215]EYM04684.1 hypothetical protein V704_00551 [Staphylococcus aureus M91652]
MNKTKYQINSDNIKSNSEETSAISSISYEIENANNNDLNNASIQTQIEILKSQNSFPKNLSYLKSYTDPKTGTTTSAFLNKDTGKVTLGMTGTVHKDAILKQTFGVPSYQGYIDASETLKDIGADVNIGLHSVTDKDPHYKNTQDFIKNIKKDYDIDIITGHSLGGRDAMILGMSNDIKHIVVYNPAPLAIKDVSGLYADQEELKKLIEKYDGHIVRFVSDEDELDAGVRNHLYETAGEKIVLKNGEGHAMSGILMSRTQAIILAELNKVKGYQDENNKALKSVRKQTRHRLHKVETLRANWIQTTGGSLSSSQQQLLEALTALTIAEGLNQLVNEESQHLKKMYHAMAHKFGDNWKKAQEVGNEIGEKLTSEEVIDELRKGGAYESKLETDPKRKIDDKIKKLNDVYKNCNGYIAKIKQSIEAIVSNDQMLASQIDGMM